MLRHRMGQHGFFFIDVNEVRPQLVELVPELDIGLARSGRAGRQMLEASQELPEVGLGPTHARECKLQMIRVGIE